MAETIVRIEDVLGLTDRGAGAVPLEALGAALTQGAAIMTPILPAVGTLMNVAGLGITAVTAIRSTISTITALKPQIDLAVLAAGAILNPTNITLLANQVLETVTFLIKQTSETAVKVALESLIKTPLFKLRDGQSVDDLPALGVEVPEFSGFELALPTFQPAIPVPSGDDVPYLDELISGA
tara:strand:+ start:1205 stop:1750 length:546 start_codon:yes stop_codon:yes gene_type:complete